MTKISRLERERILRVAARKRLLRLHEWTYEKLDLGSKGRISQVINEEVNGPRLRKRIAERTGIPYDQLWPQAA